MECIRDRCDGATNDRYLLAEAQQTALSSFYTLLYLRSRSVSSR